MTTWGGLREGAGRPPGPANLRRRHRVTVLLADADFEKLERLAAKRRISPGGLAFELVAKALKRLGRRRRAKTTHLPRPTRRPEVRENVDGP